jgi:hypothetical protein
MEKLSRSVRRAKQVKNDADWAGRTADVAEAVQLTGHPYLLTWHPYGDLADDVARVDWMTAGRVVW